MCRNCLDADPFLTQTNEQLAEMALSECARYKLADATKVIDSLVLRFPSADASQNRHNWFSKARFALLQELKQFQNLYYVNRPDLDIATLAGMEATEAIIGGNRTVFKSGFVARAKYLNLKIRLVNSNCCLLER